ncbi:J domain-containing protein [Brevibacillus ginsengisoli]|uniref:J domain-containing protein n=1 Tax=Brevibacillus ginsengisoli TaxID=363854 RepID=UPI003CE993DD
MSIWEIIGIEPTDDVAAIKRAYAKKLKVHHPEDDPEGYQRLREAYDWAIKQAGKKRIQERESEIVITSQSEDSNQSDQDDSDEIDDSELDIKTPPWIHFFEGHKEDPIYHSDKISEFMQQVEDLYDNFFARIDREKWEQLLRSDVLWDIDLKQTISEQMLEFLEDHRHLPREIWLLLDNEFQWRNQERQIYYEYSESFANYLIGAIRNPWELRYTFFPKEAEVDFDRFVGWREHAFFALMNNDMQRAKEFLANAYELYQDDPDLLRLQGEYHLRMGEPDQALAAFNHAISINGNEWDCYLSRARVFFDKEQFSAAIEDCEYFLSHHPDHLDALSLKAKCHYQLHEMEKAYQSYLGMGPNAKWDSDLYFNMHVAKFYIKPDDQRKWYQYLAHYIFSFFIFISILLRRSGRTIVILLVLQMALPFPSITNLQEQPSVHAIQPEDHMVIHNVEDLKKVHSDSTTIKATISKLEFIELFYVVDPIPKMITANKLNQLRSPAMDKKAVCLGWVDQEPVTIVMNLKDLNEVYENNGLKNGKTVEIYGRVQALSTKDWLTIKGGIDKMKSVSHDLKIEMAGKYVGYQFIESEDRVDSIEKASVKKKSSSKSNQFMDALLKNILLLYFYLQLAMGLWRAYRAV